MTIDNLTTTKTQLPWHTYRLGARPLLLLLILLAFARLVWQLDARNLWWDESLSLQRAESALLPLLRGLLILKDGTSELVTHDQHPFLFFLLTGLLIRLAGDSEFVLRGVSAAAATLLVPTVWVFSRNWVRRDLFGASAPMWGALLATLNPFFLWYGQEARPYALWAWLALVSSYLLLRATEPGHARRRFLFGYACSVPLFLTTHYFALFLLPIHALFLYLRLFAQSRRRAMLALSGLTMAGAVVAIYALWTILRQSGSGSNFAPVQLEILLPDLLNAFSAGLSVDIRQVWLLDLLFGAVALLGVVWSLRSRGSLARGGWLLPASLAVPVALLVAISFVQPAYMNARHMSMLGGPFILLVAGGMAWLWQRLPTTTGGVAVLMTATMLYSTVNYFILPQYGKPDYAGMGQHLQEKIQPGDLVLLNSPLLWRIYRYYLPIDEVEQAAARGQGTGWHGVPLLNVTWDRTAAQLEEYRGRYKRVWIARSGVNSFLDPEGKTRRWAEENLFHLQENDFFSPTSVLKLDLYLPGPPNRDDLPTTLQYPLDVVYGDRIRLRGYEVGQQVTPASDVPITLYWDPVVAIQRRYKYLMRLETPGADGEWRLLSVTEREPYDRGLPTIWWKPGPIIVEYSDLPFPAEASAVQTPLRVTLQLYDAETLEKLPITQTVNGQVADDGISLLLPFRP